MVFFFVACHLDGKDEKEAEIAAKNALGTGSRAIAELYDVPVMPTSPRPT